MEVLNQIIIKKGKNFEPVHFGVANTNEEKVDMFKLRYEIYVKKKSYIPQELIKNNLEIDSYDESNSCEYFIAKINDQIIGTLRLIKMWPLPIIKNYFKFEESEQIKKLKPEQKIEIGRLISIGKSGDKYFPRHLIPLGLFYSVVKYSKMHDIEAGYGAIKKYVYG